jgi:hypothetical protein
MRNDILLAEYRYLHDCEAFAKFDYLALGDQIRFAGFA